jgi:hypothetical protein
MMRRCSIEGCNRPHEARGWCSKHYQRWLRTGEAVGPSPEERFWAYVDKNGPPAKNRPDLGQCWLWTGGLSGGYGRFRLGSIFDGSRRQGFAHRFAYEFVVGPIPEDKVLDHFACDNGAGGCVNPFHVRPVTQAENLLRSETSPIAVNARKTHCKRGHVFDEANTRVNARGHRECRRCGAEAAREKRRRLRAA